MPFDELHGTPRCMPSHRRHYVAACPLSVAECVGACNDTDCMTGM